MRVPVVRWLGAFLFHALAMLAVAGEAKPAHRGFTYDVSAITAAELREEIVTVMNEQIDMVLAMGLSAKTIKDLQAVPISVIHAYSIGPGRYAPARGVEMASMIVAVRKRPVLIHELMHAYHDRLLAGGVRNRDVLKWHDEAKKGALYAEKSHMLSTVGEFFACSTTTYLAGATAQEPFKRATLKERQPEWFAYLQKLFGEGAGKYEGEQAPVDMRRLQEMRQKYPETHPPTKQKKKKSP
ncbi:MAG TPA: hypothetical protein VGE76_23445 [Opitutaceae bacterium]